MDLQSEVTRPDALEPSAEPGNSSASAPWPSSRQAWYAVVIFSLALAINFLDRGILTLLIPPIKRDLHLSDTQVSLLIGFAFVIFYLIVGLPIARLVDTRSRRLIIGTGLAIWSVMTGVCGLARTFWELFAARVGVGVGEACNGPATFSMMADLFPPEKLSRAIAVLNFGFVLGTGSALLLGGAVVQYVSSLPPIVLPGIGVMHAWQITFMLVGIPGLLVAMLFTTVLEPVRRAHGSFSTVVALEKTVVESDAPSAHPAGARPLQSLPVRTVARFMWDNRATYGPMFLGLAMNVILAFGVQAWVPTFFYRQYGWTMAQAGWATGIVLVLTAPFGLMTGSFLSEWLHRRGYADADLRVTLIGIVAAIPLSIAFPLMPSGKLAVALLGVQFFINMLLPGPQNAALQIVTPSEMRGQVTAFFLFIFNVVGFGFGPTFVALLTDHVFRSDALLRDSLATTAVIMGPLAALSIWWGLKAYGQSVVRARSWTR